MGNHCILDQSEKAVGCLHSDLGVRIISKDVDEGDGEFAEVELFMENGIGNREEVERLRQDGYRILILFQQNREVYPVPLENTPTITLSRKLGLAFVRTRRSLPFGRLLGPIIVKVFGHGPYVLRALERGKFAKADRRHKPDKVCQSTRGLPHEGLTGLNNVRTR